MAHSLLSYLVAVLLLVGAIVKGIPLPEDEGKELTGLNTLLTELKVRKSVRKAVKNPNHVNTYMSAAELVLRSHQQPDYYTYFFSAVPTLNRDRLLAKIDALEGEDHRVAVVMLFLAGLYCRDTHEREQWHVMITVMAWLAVTGDTLAGYIVELINEDGQGIA